MTCKKAIGVVDSMKKKFGDRLWINIFTNNSEEAKAYELKASTTVFVNQEHISLDVATSKEKMEDFLNKSIS